jgi:hypothetical protein
MLNLNIDTPSLSFSVISEELLAEACAGIAGWDIPHGWPNLKACLGYF